MKTNKEQKNTIILIIFILTLIPQNNAYYDYNYDYDYNDYNYYLITNQNNYDYNYNKTYQQNTQTTEIDKNTTNQNSKTNTNNTKIDQKINDQNNDFTQTPKQNPVNNKKYNDTNTTINADNNTSTIKTQEKCTNEDKNCLVQKLDTNELKTQNDKNYQKTDQNKNKTKNEDTNYLFTKIFVDNIPFIKIIDKNDLNYEPIEKEYYLFNQEKIKVRKEQDYNHIISNGASAKTIAEITSKENKLIAKKTNKEYEINFSPIQAYKQNNITPTEPALLEIKENKAIYLLKGKKSGKLLGLIWTEYEIKIVMDATSGKVLEEKKPFWAYLVIST
ncbi:MAG: hypothetical protein QXU92_02540 [Candidatus Diapherotrites archaeon]